MALIGQVAVERVVIQAQGCRAGVASVPTPCQEDMECRTKSAGQAAAERAAIEQVAIQA
jgi:hypothetical protein